MNILLLKKDVKKLQKELTDYDLQREHMLRIAREATRLSDIAIIHMHRQELKKASLLIKKAEKLLIKINVSLQMQPHFKEHNSILVALQELIEAKAFYKLLTEDSILSYKESGVSRAAYLLGLLDLIGELRRWTLDKLRQGDITKADKIFKSMESIYEDLSSLDHTALIPTFRHKMDTARHIIEATRGEVVSETRRISLEEALKSFERKAQWKP